MIGWPRRDDRKPLLLPREPVHGAWLDGSRIRTAWSPSSLPRRFCWPYSLDLGRAGDLQNPERLGSCLAGDLPIGRKLSYQPLLQRITAQILLDHHPRFATWCQSRQPQHQQLMQGILADANRRVGPDGVELQAWIYDIRGAHDNVRQA